MAGKKYGVVLQERVPGSYHTMPKAEQEMAGSILGELMERYAGKIDLVRRYWTSAFNSEVTDVFVIECDSAEDFHEFDQELTARLAETGDPERFGERVSVLFGINPDAD